MKGLASGTKQSPAAKRVGALAFGREWKTLQSRGRERLPLWALRGGRSRGPTLLRPQNHDNRYDCKDDGRSDPS